MKESVPRRSGISLYSWEEWESLIKACEASSLSEKEWCQQSGVDYAIYRRHRNVLRGELSSRPSVKEKWLSIMQEWEKSGLSVREWCLQNGVCYGSFLQARRRYTDRVVSQHRSQEEWIQLFEDCRNSGMTISKWCEEHGILYVTYKMAMRRLCKAGVYERGSIQSHKSKEGSEYHPVVSASVVQECLLSSESRANWCKDHGVSRWHLEQSKKYYEEHGYHFVLHSTDEHWFQIIADCYASGESVKKWCVENGVPTSTFYSRVSRLSKKYPDVAVLRENWRTVSGKWMLSFSDWKKMVDEWLAGVDTASEWFSARGYSFDTFKVRFRIALKEGIDFPFRKITESNIDDLIARFLSSKQRLDFWCLDNGFDYKQFQAIMKERGYSGVNNFWDVRLKEWLDSKECVPASIWFKKRGFKYETFRVNYKRYLCSGVDEPYRNFDLLNLDELVETYFSTRKAVKTWCFDYGINADLFQKYLEKHYQCSSSIEHSWQSLYDKYCKTDGSLWEFCISNKISLPAFQSAIARYNLEFK